MLGSYNIDILHQRFVRFFYENSIYIKEDSWLPVQHMPNVY